MLHSVNLAPEIWIKEILPIKNSCSSNILPNLECRDRSGAQHLNIVTIAHSGFKITLLSFLLYFFFIFSRCRDWLNGHNILSLNISADCLRTQLAKLAPGPMCDSLTL